MEIERKFLTRREDIPFNITMFPCLQISQAYISFSPAIRIRKSNDAYILTVKGKGLLAREEFELPLAQEEYEALQKKTEGAEIVKKRWLVPLEGGLTAEVDVYEGSLEGLVTTEVEFPSLAAAEAFVPLEWFGRDVSEEVQYKNAALARFGLPDGRKDI